MTLDQFVTDNEKLLPELFQNDLEKAKRWLSKGNMNFGGSSPKDVKKGNVRKVVFWLEHLAGLLMSEVL